MKIKDPVQKKRVGDRLRRIEGQIRGVIQMIEDEANLKEIVQQISAIRNAIGQAANEEIVCGVEKITTKKSAITEEDYDEIRSLLKIVR